MEDEAILDWLRDGDPAIRWQVERDLMGAPEGTWVRSRRDVGTTGWGAALLGGQDDDGRWAGGLYSPKWTSTFYTLQTLALLGLTSDDPRARRGVGLLLDAGVRPDGAVALWPSGAPDTCVGGMLLVSAVAFGFGSDERCQAIVGHLLGEQLDDGGWNCRRRSGASHSSFHSTLSVLEGLSAWAGSPGLAHVVADARAGGHEFLLSHRLYRSHRDGRVVHDRLTRFSFPRYWHYDVLRAVEYLAGIGADRDARCSDAIALVRRRRDASGRWRLGPRHPGATWVRMEEGGRPSRRITLGALRVLRWWEGSAA